VLPERVSDDLPKAVEAIKKQGLQPMMMTSAVIDADDPVSQQVLKTASQQGIRYYRTNWLKYPDDRGFEESLGIYRKQVQKLSQMNKQLGLQGGYQNHSGLYVGAAIWDMWEILKDADPEGMGSQYDVCHGTVEGGRCWTQNLHLIHPHIKSIALKDFKWENVDGSWKVSYTPIGEGMVDFKKYFQLLKQYGINVPVSLHMEYPIGGAEHGGRENVDQEKAFTAMKKDLQRVQKLWQEA
jgi:sugar phosphate isomerase/epimerase